MYVTLASCTNVISQPAPLVFLVRHNHSLSSTLPHLKKKKKKENPKKKQRLYYSTGMGY